MSYDSMLEGMFALAIGMGTGSATEGFEAVQNANQKNAESSCRLPRKMRPNQEAFEALGFTFTEIDDDILCEATLPEGWSHVPQHGSSVIHENLLDEKGRIRGHYYYKGAFYDRCGSMCLYNRFTITYQQINPDAFESPVNVVVLDFDDSIIFDAGQCSEPYTAEYDALVKDAEDFLNSNYPEWRDCTKYWD